MTQSSKYFIWLTLALGYSSPKPKAILRLYRDISSFYLGGENEWRLCGLLNQKDIESLRTTPLPKAFEVIGRCNELGITILSLDDIAYPAILKEIDTPPAVLYVKGSLPDFETQLSIAMVGTRHATAYGKKTSHILSGALANAGVVVVSGGALGVDSLCHTAAVENGGVTVCVLGCGINFPYLTENRKLRQAIAERGAVISEYPPDYPPGKYTFPERNRIISGLCDGVVVIEAGVKSGSLITARLAAEQGRDVFAVMGNITSPYSQGTNALIKDGAVPVTDVDDIISYYPQYRLSAQQEELVAPVPVHKTDIDVSDEAKRVYAAVTSDPVHVDTIISSTSLPVHTALQALTELELEGLVEADKGRMYHII